MKYLLSAFALTATCAWGQTPISRYEPVFTAEGAVYYLPMTQLRVAVLVEKTSYTPGDLCDYAQKYMKLDKVSPRPYTAYRAVSMNLWAEGVADTSKCYSVRYNGKGAASNLSLSDDGVLQAVNAQPLPVREHPAFVAAPRKKIANPRTFLSQEIIESGSKAKMAELVAQEIYAIRDSRSQLTRGEADFMPKDGEQLRIMLERLQEQEEALLSMFAGVTERDTVEHVFTYCPKRGVEKEVLFRLSSHLGLVDKDDLSGKPYYIKIEDFHHVPEPVVDPKAKKKPVLDGIFVNVPGKVKASLLKDTQVMGSLEFSAGQYGHAELLSGDLFNKKFTTHLILNPITGAIHKLDAEQPQK